MAGDGVSVNLVSMSAGDGASVSARVLPPRDFAYGEGVHPAGIQLSLVTLQLILSPTAAAAIVAELTAALEQMAPS